MPTRPHSFPLLRAALIASTLLAAAHAQDKGPITQAKAQQLIQSGTLIQACGDATYTFQSVQVGTTLKQKLGEQVIDLYPVHARFAVTCRYGDSQMRAEVDYTAAYYRDPFGAWQSSGPDFDGDQSWNSTQSDVRCRVQTLAHLTVDSSGKVTGSTPVSDHGYIGCTVMSKAAE